MGLTYRYRDFSPVFARYDFNIIQGKRKEGLVYVFLWSNIRPDVFELFDTMLTRPDYFHMLFS